MLQGTVKRWNFSYGFITNSETGKDIFVHNSNLNDGLKELEPGKEVTYEVAIDETSGKENAVNVTVI